MSASREREKTGGASSEKKFCPLCGRPSEWWGACDDCEKKYGAREQAADLTARQEQHVNCEWVPTSWRWYRFEESNRNIENMNKTSWEHVRLWTPLAGNLYLWGPTGTGKTFAAACLLSKALEDNGTVAVTTGLHMCHHGDAFGSENLVEAWRTATVLLIDDIDKGPWSPRTLAIMHFVFDGRATARKAMIITSNISPAGFVDMLSECAPDWNQSYVDSIAGRLNPCEKLEYTGESLRGKMEG